ncbi:MAG: flagellar filament capping protein FliD [Treponema sp.]
MADLSIPGVNNQYEKLVEAIMKAERLPREKVATELEKYKGFLSFWQSLNQFSSQVKDVSRSFYSFNNPFNEHIATSSNESSITAVATRDAKEQVAKIAVKQIASADSFLSDEVSKDMKVEAGTYIFRVGEKTLELKWNGGNYKSFMQAINRRGKGLISASEMKVTPKTTSILLTSSLLGEKNKLIFEGDALNWALKMGFIKKGESGKTILEYSNVKISSNSSTSLKLEKLPETKNAELLEIVFSFQDKESDVKLAENEVNSKPKDEILNKGEQDNSNAVATLFEAVGSVSYKGIILKNNPSKVFDEGDASLAPKDEVSNGENESEEVKESFEGDEQRIDEDVKAKDLDIFTLKFENGEFLKLTSVKDTQEKQVLHFPLSEDKKVGAVLLDNDNDFPLKIESIKVFTKDLSGEYIPTNPASTAADAIISYQGIEMKRDSNKIDDIIPSVTLDLHSKTEKAEDITIKPDVELVKSSIIEFVAKYNRLMAEINILTTNKNEVVEELSYFSDDEKESALKRLGSFYGDTTLSSLKSNLQQRMSNAYGASEDLPIKLLSEMGISTNANSGQGIDASRLRGYLEIDEKVLEKALTDNMEGVKDFFGYDSDGDIIIDSGLAYAIYEYLNPYTQRGGIFFNRIASVQDKIKTSEKRIVDYDKKLAQKEADLKRKYGMMEGTLKDLKKQSDAISNFNKSLEK